MQYLGDQYIPFQYTVINLQEKSTGQIWQWLYFILHIFKRFTLLQKYIPEKYHYELYINVKVTSIKALYNIVFLNGFPALFSCIALSFSAADLLHNGHH